MRHSERLHIGLLAFGIAIVSTSYFITMAAQPNAKMATQVTPFVPVQIEGIPGSMISLQGWPLLGAHPHDVGGIFEANYSRSGPTIDEVRWTWPSEDLDPRHYVVVPTTIRGNPYMVWCHLAPERKLGKPENGSAGYGPNQLEPMGPSQMWMTPWTRRGGSLTQGATLITSDIPPAFSSSVRYVFPSNPHTSTPQDLADSAWAGWFKWGEVLRPFAVSAPKSATQYTVAVPDGLFPAYNGVVLAVRTQVLLANQGEAVNLYYLDLARHRIVGLASLTNGGGLFSSMWVVSGIVFTGSATDLDPAANLIAKAFMYNEVTGTRTRVESSAVMSQNNGFNDWTIRGNGVYDANYRLVARLTLPAKVLREPSAATFAVPVR